MSDGAAMFLMLVGLVLLIGGLVGVAGYYLIPLLSLLTAPGALAVLAGIGGLMVFVAAHS